MPHARLSKVRDDVLGGLVSAAVAIPLAMGYGMFALVSLGDEYFDNGAFAGLCAAFVVAVVSVVLGDKTPTVYAPRINSTFFLGARAVGLHRLLHPGGAGMHSCGPGRSAALLLGLPGRRIAPGLAPDDGVRPARVAHYHGAP